MAIDMMDKVEEFSKEDRKNFLKAVKETGKIINGLPKEYRDNFFNNLETIKFTPKNCEKEGELKKEDYGYKKEINTIVYYPNVNYVFEKDLITLAISDKNNKKYDSEYRIRPGIFLSSEKDDIGYGITSGLINYYSRKTGYRLMNEPSNNSVDVVSIETLEKMFGIQVLESFFKNDPELLYEKYDLYDLVVSVDRFVDFSSSIVDVQLTPNTPEFELYKKLLALDYKKLAINVFNELISAQLNEANKSQITNFDFTKHIKNMVEKTEIVLVDKSLARFGQKTIKEEVIELLSKLKEKAK